MRVNKIILLFLAGLAGYTGNCQQIDRDPAAERCRRASVTPVSCAQSPAADLLPHPDHCELFYYCVSRDAAPVCRACPARLHFNPRLLVCDHLAAAGCRARPPRPEPEPTTDATTTDMTTEGDAWSPTTERGY